MKRRRIPSGKTRACVFAGLCVLLALGIFLALTAATRSRDAIIREHEKYLSQLASTVDHNVGVVLNRCRVELSDLIASDTFQSAEQAFATGDDTDALRAAMGKSPVLLTDYADRMIVRSEEKTLLSTAENDALRYSVLDDTAAAARWLCVDNAEEKNYIALSCPSETCQNVYYVLVDLDLFFRRVVVDTIYGDYRIVLYDGGSGLMLQNDEERPDYVVLSKEELQSRDDAYSRIYACETAGEAGASVYRYTNAEGKRQAVRIYVIPSSLTGNRIFATAVAVYDEPVIASIRQIMLVAVIAAVLIAFSAAAGIFFFLHNGRREQELAAEVTFLEKEKQLREEILRQQEQVFHRQKLETVGIMTAGIAHEFNNLLTPIMGNSMLILEKSRTESPEIFENALDIYDASDRAKDLIARISRLTRRQEEPKMQPVLPEKLLSDVLSMAEASIPTNISIHKVIRTDKRINGVESQLVYMLLNLMINAVQAMKPDGGTLTVSADAEGENVLLAVADTGPGIPEENLERIFDPFFTTKEAGKGTGLGLPIARHIATDHAGTVRVENLPGGGAKFTVTIPAIPEM